MDTNVSGVKSSTTLHSHAKILISVARLATEREGERGRRELWDRRGRRTEARGGVMRLGFHRYQGTATGKTALVSARECM